MKIYLQAFALKISLFKTLNILLYMFLGAASIVSLYYLIGGIRVFLYDFVGLFYFLSILGSLLLLGKVKLHRKQLIIAPLMLIILIFLSEIISISGVISNMPNSSFEQFFKLFSYSFILKLILVCLLVHQSLTNFKYSEKLLLFYCYGLGISCIYQFVAIYYAVVLNTNIATDTIFGVNINQPLLLKDVSYLRF